MKNVYPVVTVASSDPVEPTIDTTISRDDKSNDEIDYSTTTSPIIRLKLDKPLHWYWELTTTGDDELPVIQLLDKDGRLLVETTGKTAQRARGSFRMGMTDHEKFPSNDKISRSTSVRESICTRGNRNVDGFSNKFGPIDFGYEPRKSRSDVGLKTIREKRLARNDDKDESNEKKVKKTFKRYSTGDFLRRQILDDLRTRNASGKSPTEIAEERCKKVKAYLKGIRNSSDRTSVRNDREDDDKFDKIESELEDRESNENDESMFHPRINDDDDERVVTDERLVKIRNFLTEKLLDKMESSKPGNDDSTSIRRLHSDRKKNFVVDSEDMKRRYRARKVRSDTNVINSSRGGTRFEWNETMDGRNEKVDTNFGSFRSNERNDWRNVNCFKKNNYRRSKSDALLSGRSYESVDQQQQQQQ